MSFSITCVGIAEDGRLLVTLKSNPTGTQTQIWVAPNSRCETLQLPKLNSSQKRPPPKSTPAKACSSTLTR